MQHAASHTTAITISPVLANNDNKTNVKTNDTFIHHTGTANKATADSATAILETVLPLLSHSVYTLHHVKTL